MPARPKVAVAVPSTLLAVRCYPPGMFAHLPLPDHLVLHPTPLAAEQAAWETTSACVCGAQHLTPTVLWGQLARPQGARQLAAAEVGWLLRQLLPEQAAPLAEMADDAFAVQALQAGVATLRAAGVVAARLPAVGASAELQALRALLEAYEEALLAQGWADPADLQRQAILDVLQGQLPDSLRAVRALTVRPGTEVFGPLLDLLNAFAAVGVAVQVDLPWDPARAQAFAWPEAWLHGIEGRGHPRLQLRQDPRHGSGPLAPLRAAQFASPPAPPVAAPVQLWQLGTGSDREMQLARQLAAWLAAGVATDAIAVVGADAAALARLAGALGAMGVPVAYAPRRRLLDGLGGHFLLDLWRGAASGWPLEEVLGLWDALVRPDAAGAGARSGLRWLRQVGGLDVADAQAALRAQGAARGGVWPARAEQLAAELGAFVAQLQQLPAGGDLGTCLQLSQIWLRRLPPAAAAAAAADQAALQAALQHWAQLAVAWPEQAYSAAAWADWLAVQLAAWPAPEPPRPRAPWPC